jgi:hypothetical protein
MPIVQLYMQHNYWQALDHNTTSHQTTLLMCADWWWWWQRKCCCMYHANPEVTIWHLVFFWLTYLSHLNSACFCALRRTHISD